VQCALAWLNIAERNGLGAGTARGYASVGIVCDLVGRFGLADWYHRRAVDLAQQVQHPQALGDSWFGVSCHEYFARQQVAAARAAARDAAAVYARAGDLRWWAVAIGWEGYLSYYACDVPRMQEVGEQLMRVGLETADRQLEALGHAHLGTANRVRGNLDEAIGHLRHAADLFRAVPYYSGLIADLGELGACHMHRGELAEAITILKEAEQILRDRRLRGPLCTPVVGHLTEAYLLAAERAAASERALLLRQAGRACQASLTQVKFDPAHRGCAYRLRGTYEWLRNKPAAARQWWQHAVQAAERLGVPQDVGRAHLDMGRHLREREHVERALAIFDECGAGVYARHARAALAKME
jgi:tetratricopeptide (TPR) repeat protein